MGDVEGNKDIEIHAGNLELNALRPQDYARADFSVRIGDVYAPLFRTVKSGFWRSFKTVGPGKYRLHAHVDVGDLTLHAFRLLHEKPHVRARLAARFPYLLADGYQDLSFAQSAMTRLLTQERRTM